MTKLNQSKDCHFCHVASGNAALRVHDQQFTASSNYFAMASVGALVEGWSLVCPKKHSVSMRQHYGNSEFRLLLDDVVKRVTSRYGSPIFFEHGANCASSATGCGV